MSDVLSRRTVPDPAARREARRNVVLRCLQTAASMEPVNRPLGQAAARTTAACAAIIDRFNQAEATDAAFRGAEPPSPVELAGNRTEFEAEAARLLNELRAGNCRATASPAASQ